MSDELDADGANRLRSEITRLRADMEAFSDAANEANARIVMLEEARDRLRDRMKQAAAEFDKQMDEAGGCTDGSCLIKKPTGQHTNGGCDCSRDNMKMQRLGFAARKLRAAQDQTDD